MSYDLKYQSDFYNTPPFKKKVSVKLYKKDYGVHDTIFLRTIEVRIDANYQDENTPIIGRGAKVNIVNEGTFASLNDLLKAREKEFKCIIEYNNELVFQGFSICDLNEQQFLPKSIITLQFTDYLRRLESDSLECLVQAGENSNLITMIHEAIYRIGFDYPLYVNSTLFETTMNAGSTDTFLEQTFLEHNIFYTDANKYDNTYDALNKALKSFNAHLFFLGDKWILERIDDVTRTGNWVVFSNIYDSAGYEIGVSIASLKQEYNKQLDHFKYHEGTPIVEYDSGLKTLILQLKDKQLDSFVFNNYTVNMLSAPELIVFDSKLWATTGTLALKTWYKFIDATIFRIGYAFRGMGSYVEWKYVAGNYAGLYYCFKLTINIPENYVNSPDIMTEIPTELSISYKQSGRTDLIDKQAVATHFSLMIDEGDFAGYYLEEKTDPSGAMFWGLSEEPNAIRNDFDVSVNGNKNNVWSISESINLTDQIIATDPLHNTLLIPSIWEQLNKPASIKFIVSFFPCTYITKTRNPPIIIESDNIIGDIQISIGQQRVPNKLTYFISADFIKTETQDIDFFDLSNDNFSNGIETEPDDSSGALPVKTVNWVTSQHPIPAPLMDIYARVKFGNYCHTIPKLKGTIMFDGHLKPLSILSDNNLIDDGIIPKLILHGYSWNLNEGTYEIEAVEFTEETIIPEEEESSSALLPPESSDIISIGGFYVNLYPESLSWAYNDLSTKTFMVYTNMPQWYFHSDNYHVGFDVTVWDRTNTVQITNYVYTSNMIVRVTPIANNTGVVPLHAYINIANSYNEKMPDGDMVCTQNYQEFDVPPIVTGVVSDGMLTLGTFDYILHTANTSLMIMWTPATVDNSLPTDFPLYITITRGATVVASAQYPHNTEGWMRAMWITLNEAAVSGETYQVSFKTTNV